MTIPANDTNSIVSGDGRVGIFFRLDTDVPELFDDVLVITKNNSLWDEGARLETVAYNQDEATPQRALLTLAYLVAHTNHVFDVQFGAPAPRPEPPALSEILAGVHPVDVAGLPQPPTTWAEFVPFMIANFSITEVYTLGVKSAQPAVSTPTPSAGDKRVTWETMGADFNDGTRIEYAKVRHGDGTYGIAFRCLTAAGWVPMAPCVVDVLKEV